MFKVDNGSLNDNTFTVNMSLTKNETGEYKNFNQLFCDLNNVKPYDYDNVKTISEIVGDISEVFGNPNAIKERSANIKKKLEASIEEYKKHKKPEVTPYTVTPDIYALQIPLKIDYSQAADQNKPLILKGEVDGTFSSTATFRGEEAPFNFKWYGIQETSNGFLSDVYEKNELKNIAYSFQKQSRHLTPIMPGHTYYDLTVEKDWAGVDASKQKPVTVELYKDDIYTGKTITLDHEHNWKSYFFIDDVDYVLDKSKFTVKEVGEKDGQVMIGEDKFDVSYSDNHNDKITITNTYIEPEKPVTPTPEEPVTPKPTVPEAGDNNNPMMWMIAILAMIGLAGVSTLVLKHNE